MSLFANHALTWFEIPTLDFARATAFYEEVLDTKLEPFEDDVPCNMFPRGEGGVGGCLAQRPGSRPGCGTTVYLNVEGKLDACLKRAEKRGATITVPRTPVPGGRGYFGCLVDSEGNSVGLYSTEF